MEVNGARERKCMEWRNEGNKNEKNSEFKVHLNRKYLEYNSNLYV